MVVVLGLELVHAHDHFLAAVDAGLAARRGLLDAHLGHAGLDRLGHAAQRLDLVDQLARLGDQAGGQRFDVVAAGQRIDDLGDAGLVLEDELGVARDARGGGRRQRDRLVERIGVQRLRAAQHRRHRLVGGADHVVVGVLLGERHARGLAVRAQRQRIGLLGLERLDQLGPQEARGAELGHFHEEVHADAEEEREPRREGVDVEALGLGGADVFEPVGQREGQLLDQRRARLLHVIAGDRDRVELRHVLARCAR